MKLTAFHQHWVRCRAALCYADVPREDDATGQRGTDPDCSEVSSASSSTFHVFFWLPYSRSIYKDRTVRPEGDTLTIARPDQRPSRRWSPGLLLTVVTLIGSIPPDGILPTAPVKRRHAQPRSPLCLVAGLIDRVPVRLPDSLT